MSTTTALVKKSPGELGYGKFTLTPTDLVFPEQWTWEDWAECGQALEKANDATYWWIGDWALAGYRRYLAEEKCKPKKGRPGASPEFWQEKGEGIGLRWKTVAAYSKLAERVSFDIRISKLQLGHHQAVQKLHETPGLQRRWLNRALKEGWTPTQLRQAIAAEGREKLALTLKGVFQVFYADPPWDYSNTGFDGAASHRYPTMPTDEICALPVKKYATDDAVLFLWATNPVLPDCLRVVEAWGFDYKTNFVWVKDASMHLGFYNYAQHELLLIGVRGSMLPKERSMVQSVLNYPRAEHSAKPPEVYDIIEQMYPKLRRVELFARGEEREGWKFWGNEVL